MAPVSVGAVVGADGGDLSLVYRYGTGLEKDRDVRCVVRRATRVDGCLKRSYCLIIDFSLSTKDFDQERILKR